MGARGAKFSRIERQHHLSDVATLLLQRVPKSEIAKQLGVTPGQITYDCKMLRKTWRQKASANIADVMAQELAAITLQEKEAWAAWMRSCVQHGDPRFLQILISLRRQKMELLGVFDDPQISLLNIFQLAREEEPTLLPQAQNFDEWLEMQKKMEAVLIERSQTGKVGP